MKEFVYLNVKSFRLCSSEGLENAPTYTPRDPKIKKKSWGGDCPLPRPLYSEEEDTPPLTDPYTLGGSILSLGPQKSVCPVPLVLHDSLLIVLLLYFVRDYIKVKHDCECCMHAVVLYH